MTGCAGCGEPLPVQGRGRQRKWCSERCRKYTSYGGACVDCGARTNGNNGPGKASVRCRSCRHEWERANAIWSRERIIRKIQQFAETYGRQPRVTDFIPSHARRIGHHGRVPEGHWPALETIARYCGSWNEAIRAAGFEPFDQVRDHDWAPNNRTVRDRVFGE